MNAITPLARAVLDALDTSERGAGDSELFVDTWSRREDACDHDALLHTLAQMIDHGLIEARLADWPSDASVSADPIIYEITEAGCETRWALQKAETLQREPVRNFDDEGWRQPRPVCFESREAFIDFCRGARA